ncbi:MAG: acyl-CoA dehydrogenase family protein [Planctomycetes bacterium]|nr:acyl-CoA dehydrogenase family protein [Planctomycetota bacterium]
MDISHTSWPFFEESHREFAAKFSKWCGAAFGPRTRGTDVSSVEKHEHDARATDEYQRSRKIVKALGEAGWLRNCVIAPHGGSREKLDVRTLCLSRETLAFCDGLADFAFAMQGLGAGPVSIFGTEAQRAKYLPRVASGEWVAAFALSEEAAGSDPSAMAVSAAKDGSDYVLSGEKMWISNAGIADFYSVFARTGEGPGTKGISAFVVGADANGLTVPERIEVISPHPLGKVRFDGVRVSAEALVGKPGEGFKVAMGTLDVFRSTVAAAALGFARRALHESIAHANSREVFGQKLCEFQMTQDKIADMATEVDASALLVYRSAWLKDSGADRITRESSMAKYYATEAAQRVIDKAVQLFGGRGVVSGEVVERLYRDIRPLRIYEGTSEIQKVVIARQTLR